MVLNVKTGETKEFLNRQTVISLVNDRLLVKDDVRNDISIYNITGKYYTTQTPGNYRVVGYHNGRYYFASGDKIYVLVDDGFVEYPQSVQKYTVQIGFVNVPGLSEI
jgi:hypothetical protein